jgi:predicted transcriptional regulator
LTRSMIFRLVLVGMAVAALQRVQAGSAVATDGHGHTVYSSGHPKSVAIQRAMETARLYGWTDARIVAATDVTGYSAIAVGSKGKNSSVLGIVLGHASREDAEKSAIEECFEAGETDVQVRWRFNG